MPELERSPERGGFLRRRQVVDGGPAGEYLCHRKATVPGKYHSWVSGDLAILTCSTFFRRLLIESGEDPDALVLSDRERVVVEYGRQLGRDAHGVSDAIYAQLARLFTQEQIVALTAFGVIMLATNVFNNALRVDLDGYLEPYRAEGATPGRPAGAR